LRRQIFDEFPLKKSQTPSPTGMYLSQVGIEGHAMEYTVYISKAIHGEVVPLVHVSESMARSKATSEGIYPLHGPTLEAVRPGQIGVLLSAAKSGALKVCNHDGQLMSVESLVTGDVSALFKDVEGLSSLILLHTRLKHLNDWAASNGDSFIVKDSGVTKVEFDLTDEAGNVLKKGFYRGFVDNGNANPAAEGPSQFIAGTAPAASALTLQYRAKEWASDAQSRAREIIKEQKSRDLYPDQIGIADQIAREFRIAGRVGSDGKPISGAYIKRHALKGISSAIGKQLSTTRREGK
jgi:hypothetical protein